MRWKGRRQSTNVEDRRRVSGKQLGVGGGLAGVILVVVVLLMGGDPGALLRILQNNQPAAPQQAAVDDQLGDFVKVVLADTEDVWNSLLRGTRWDYREPTLVMFSGSVRSACGFNSAAVGPFYCPADEKVYIDLSFYSQLRDQLGAGGDFAQAYVIAHEVGHHVQNLMGITDRVHGMRGRMSEEEYNQMSVRLELQADFFAGVWSHHAQRMHQILERGDIEEALRAAEAIGDDRIQRKGQGYVVPESFTHGTSEQRVRWFRKGFETGDIDEGDTFRIPYGQL